MIEKGRVGKREEGGDGVRRREKERVRAKERVKKEGRDGGIQGKRQERGDAKTRKKRTQQRKKDEWRKMKECRYTKVKGKRAGGGEGLTR